MRAAERGVVGGTGAGEVGAVFDFDGTLIDGYSALAFYEHRLRNLELGPYEAARTVAAGLRGVETEDQFRAIVEPGVRAWEGRFEDDLAELGERIFRGAVAGRLFPGAWQLVKDHQRRGHTVAIASSATRFQVEPVARELGIEHVLCTELECVDGILTGRLAGDPLWGPTKAAAVRELAAAHGLDLKRSYAYANGDEDVPLLEAVGKPQAVNPSARVAELADEHGWPVHRFGARGRPGIVELVRTVAGYGGVLGGLGTGTAVGLLNRDRRQAIDLATSLAGDLGPTLAGVRLDVRGEEHLWSRRPAVFIFNHQSSLVDLMIVARLVRRGFAGVVKRELAGFPIFGQFFRLADFAFVERSGGDPDALRRTLEPAVEKLRSGVSLVVAPEGTRSVTPSPGEFKKGAFHLAMQAGVPLVPIVIHNAGELMWRDAVTLRPGAVTVTVHRPVSVAGWTADDLDERIAEVRQLYVDTLESR